MIQKRLIFLLLLISFKISIAEDECSSKYEKKKRRAAKQSVILPLDYIAI